MNSPHPEAGSGKGRIAHRFRNAEVGDLRRPVGGQHDILRLHIAVDQGTGVGMAKPGENLRQDADNFIDRQRAVGAHQLLEVRPFDQFHDEVVADAGPGPADDVRGELDRLDPTARRVFEGLRSHRFAQPDEIAGRSGVPALEVIRALPTLELAGLAEAGDGGHRIAARLRGQGRPGPQRTRSADISMDIL